MRIEEGGGIRETLVIARSLLRGLSGGFRRREGEGRLFVVSRLDLGLLVSNTRKVHLRRIEAVGLRHVVAAVDVGEVNLKRLLGFK